MGGFVVIHAGRMQHRSRLAPMLAIGAGAEGDPPVTPGRTQNGGIILVAGVVEQVIGGIAEGGLHHDVRPIRPVDAIRRKRGTHPPLFSILDAVHTKALIAPGGIRLPGIVQHRCPVDMTVVIHDYITAILCQPLRKGLQVIAFQQFQYPIVIIGHIPQGLVIQPVLFHCGIVKHRSVAQRTGHLTMKFRCEPPTGGAGAVIHPVVIEEGQLDPVGTHKDPPFCFRFLSFYHTSSQNTRRSPRKTSFYQIMLPFYCFICLTV